MMPTPCARFPVAGRGPRCSVFGPRRRSSTESRVPGTRDLRPGTRGKSRYGRDSRFMFQKRAHGV
jgi:hypothetical protein